MTETPIPPAAQTITCVIPVYNEQDRLPAVLAVLAGHPMLDEVLVVDDGSDDDSARVAEETAGVTLLRQPENGGKTKALAAGISAARNPLIMLVDGDLVGLTAADITRLAVPVRSGRADISISLRGNAPRLWHWIGLDYISGERVFPRSLLPPLAALHGLPAFGFEVYLNARLVAQKARIAVVPWPDVKSPLKSDKRGALAGIRADIAMLRDMFRTVAPWRLVRQILAMRRLRVRGD